MRLLDLFCGAGGAAMGYYQAGFDEILGVDIRPQPRYPFRFIQADALEFLARFGPSSGWDLIHASPPCQHYSVANNIWKRDHPDLLDAVREGLQRAGSPYVIENVVGAPLRSPVLVCGVMFGLKVFRHRLFESSELLLQPPHMPHGGRAIGRDGFCCVAGHGDSNGHKGKRKPVPPDHRSVAAWRRAMGIDWMTRSELAQAIPPAYTKWIGEQLR
jgi:DNA (cytosine-5)-methyltransferase 1